jgi:hypothetical protein
MSRRRLWSGLLFALLAVLLGGAGWALAASTKAPPVNAQIVANFAQFRRARTPADTLPASIRPEARGCWGPGWPYGRRADPATFGLASYYQFQCVPAFAGPPRDRSLTARQIITGLQRDQSRAVRLPGRLGKLWLIPSGRWLCNVWRFPSATGPGISFSMACESITEVLAHPPLWPGGAWCSPCGRSNGADLFALEPDRVTKVTLGYPGGSQPTYLANNVLGACVGNGSSWLEQTGPSETITTPLGGGKLDGLPARYRPRKCPGLP